MRLSTQVCYLLPHLIKSQPYNRPVKFEGETIQRYNQSSYLPLETLVKCPHGTHPISLWDCASIPKRTMPLTGSCPAATATFDEELKKCVVLDRAQATLQCSHGYLIGHKDKKLCKNHARVPPMDQCDAPYGLVDGMCEKRRIGPVEIGCMPGEKKEGYKCIRADHIPMILKCPEGFSPRDTPAKDGTCERKNSWPGTWHDRGPHCSADGRIANDTIGSHKNSTSRMLLESLGDAHFENDQHVWIETVYQDGVDSFKKPPEVLCSQYDYTIGKYVCEDPDGIAYDEWVKPKEAGGHGNWPMLHFMSHKVGNPKYSCVAPRAYPWRPVCPDFRGRAFVRTLMTQDQYIWYERPPGLIWAAGKPWVDLYKKIRSGEAEDDEAPAGSNWSSKRVSEVKGRPHAEEAFEKPKVGNLTPGFLDDAVESDSDAGDGLPAPLANPDTGEQLPDTGFRGLGVRLSRQLSEKNGPIRDGASLTGAAWHTLNKKIWRSYEEQAAADKILPDNIPSWDVDDSELKFHGLADRLLAESHQHIMAHDTMSQDLLRSQLSRALGLEDDFMGITLDNRTIDGRIMQIMRVGLNPPKTPRRTQSVAKDQPVNSDGSKTAATNQNSTSSKSSRAKYDPETMERPGPIDELPDPDDYRAAAEYVNNLSKQMYNELHPSILSQDDFGVESLIKLLSPKPLSIDVASRLWVSWVHEGLIVPSCVEYEIRKPRQRCPDSFRMGTDMSCKPTDYAPPYLLCPPEYTFEPESILRWKEIDALEKDPKNLKKEAKHSSNGKYINEGVGENLVIRAKNMPKCIGFVETYTDYRCEDPHCVADIEHRICVCDMTIVDALESPTKEELIHLWGGKGGEIYDMNMKYLNLDSDPSLRRTNSTSSSTTTVPPRESQGSSTAKAANTTSEEQAVPIPKTQWYPFTPGMFPMYIFRQTFREIFTPEFRKHLFKIREMKTGPEYAIYRALYDPSDYIHWVRRKRDMQTEFVVSNTADRILVIANRGKIGQQLYMNAYEPSEYNWGGTAYERVAGEPVTPAPVVNRYSRFEDRQDEFGERRGPPISLAASADQSSFITMGGLDKNPQIKYTGSIGLEDLKLKPSIEQPPRDPLPFAPRRQLSKKQRYEDERREAYEYILSQAKHYEYESFGEEEGEIQFVEIPITRAHKTSKEKSFEKHVLGLIHQNFPYIQSDELQEALNAMYKNNTHFSSADGVHYHHHAHPFVPPTHAPKVKQDMIIDRYARPNINRWRQSIRAPQVLDENGSLHFSLIPEDYW